jgi:hypothetical protein
VISRYEQLRSQALGKLFPDGRGLGLALFMRKGMAAWMQTWSEHTAKVKTVNTQVLDTGKLIPENTTGQLTTVLTNMIMDLNRKEAEYGFTYKPESNERAPAAQSVSLCTPILIAAGTHEPGERQTSVCSPATSSRIGLAQRTNYYS